MPIACLAYAAPRRRPYLEPPRPPRAFNNLDRFRARFALLYVNDQTDAISLYSDFLRLPSNEHAAFPNAPLAPADAAIDTSSCSAATYGSVGV